MATKCMKNLFGGLFNKPEQDPAKKEPELVSESRQREKDMIARLEAIDLDDPQRMLSDEKIKELNVPGVIKYACSELKFPLITDQNIVNLDNNMRYIIDALEEAVMEGREMTAEWACTALVFAIKNLRTDIAAVDQEYAKEVMECRVEYSENLKLLVQLCREHDTLTAKLEDQHRRRDEKRQELDRLKNHYQTRRDSGALDIAAARLKQYAHNPAQMGDEAMALRDELSQIHLYYASLVEVETTISADQLTLNNRTAEIESRRNALSNPPHVTDPKLHDRINEANRIYREKLRRELNQAEESLRSYDIHISAMSELANHSVQITSVAIALEMIQKMDLEKYQHMLAEQDAEKLRAQDAANVAAIKETIRVQQEEWEQLRNTEPVAEQQYEQQYEQQPVYNTEYDYE